MNTAIPAWKQKSKEHIEDFSLDDEGVSGRASLEYHDDEIYFHLQELGAAGDEELMKELLAERYASRADGLNFLKRRVQVLAYRRRPAQEPDGSSIACYEFVYRDIGSL